MESRFQGILTVKNENSLTLFNYGRVSKIMIRNGLLGPSVSNRRPMNDDQAQDGARGWREAERAARRPILPMTNAHLLQQETSHRDPFPLPCYSLSEESIDTHLRCRKPHCSLSGLVGGSLLCSWPWETASTHFLWRLSGEQPPPCNSSSPVLCSGCSRISSIWADVVLLIRYLLLSISPSGKLVQIEHALTAVGSGQTSLGIKGRFAGIMKRYGSPGSNVEAWLLRVFLNIRCCRVHEYHDIWFLFSHELTEILFCIVNSVLQLQMVLSLQRRRSCPLS